MFLFEVKDGFKNTIKTLFYIFIAIFPFLIYEGYLFNGSSTRSINTILFVEILTIIIGLYVLSKKTKISFRFSWITVSLFVLFLTLLASSILGVDFGSSFWSKATRTTGIFYFFHIGLFYLFFGSFFADIKEVRKAIKVFVFSAGFLSFISILGQDGLGWIFKNKNWQGVTIGNSTFAGMYIYAGFMLAVYLLATQKTNKGIWKNFLPIIFVLSPYILSFDIWRGDVSSLYGIIGSAQASSITLFISIVALIIFYFVSKLKNYRIRKTILVSAVVLCLVSFLIFVNSLLKEGGRVQEVYLNQSTATRPIVWKFSSSAVSERPVLGWGVDNFSDVYQKYYDNRVLELKNGGEGWLDRAHNVFVDQTVETGYLGITIYILVYISIFGSLLFVLIKSKEKENLILVTVLLVYFVGHLLELQTAFDTTITYMFLAILASITATLFIKTKEEVSEVNKNIKIPEWLKYSGVVVLMSTSLVFFVIGTLPIMKAEGANGAVRRVGSSEKRILLYENLFSSPLDQGFFIWRTYNDLQRGVSLNPKIIEDKDQRDGLIKEIESLVSYYEKYIDKKPSDFRAKLGIADLYIYQRLLDIDNLDKAHEVLNDAIKLVPQAPQSYWMQSVAYLYQGKFKLAREFANKAYDLGPDIEESQRLKEYIDNSIRDFPVIDLYSFKQI